MLLASVCTKVSAKMILLANRAIRFVHQVGRRNQRFRNCLLEMIAKASVMAPRLLQSKPTHFAQLQDQVRRQDQVLAQAHLEIALIWLQARRKTGIQDAL
jgi:hypothetical protein